MTATWDPEEWLLNAGDALLQRKAAGSLATLSIWDRAVYSLWVADYGMRNAGDLQAAYDLWSVFKAEGVAAAAELGLPSLRLLFSLSDSEFEAIYGDMPYLVIESATLPQQWLMTILPCAWAAS